MAASTRRRSASSTRLRGAAWFSPSTHLRPHRRGPKDARTVQSGLGEMYYYDSVRVNLGLFQHDVSVVWDLAVHDLSIMDHVSPPAGGGRRHRREPRRRRAENIAYLTLHFANTLIAHIHVNWLAPVKVRRTLIGGSRRMIVYDDLEPSEKIKVYDKGITLKRRAPPRRRRHSSGNGGLSLRRHVGFRTWRSPRRLPSNCVSSSSAWKAAARPLPTVMRGCASCASWRRRPSRWPSAAVSSNSSRRGGWHDPVPRPQGNMPASGRT